MFINAYEQMTTGVSDITSIALVTLEVIHNALLINELRLWFACHGQSCRSLTLVSL